MDQIKLWLVVVLKQQKLVFRRVHLKNNSSSNAGRTLAISLKNNKKKKKLSKPVIKKPISRKERAQQKRKEMIRAFYKSNSMGSYNTEKSTSSLKEKKNQLFFYRL